MRTPFRFPPDLLAIERAWLATYTDLAKAPATGTTVLRQRLIALSGQLCTHPYWETAADWRAGGVAAPRRPHTRPRRTEPGMNEQATGTPRSQPVPATRGPGQTGPCARYRFCARYGTPANPPENPFCETRRAKRRAQHGN
ncbi:hypothetical protein [Streptomyces sp. NPDC051183]|uniref:hypothetical protein n=1 Tax=Streptomyces sp. NPDC051183 TaxID=3155165 RepID=UPI00343232D1